MALLDMVQLFEMQLSQNNDIKYDQEWWQIKILEWDLTNMSIENLEWLLELEKARILSALKSKIYFAIIAFAIIAK